MGDLVRAGMVVLGTGRGQVIGVVQSARFGVKPVNDQKALVRGHCDARHKRAVFIYRHSTDDDRRHAVRRADVHGTRHGGRPSAAQIRFIDFQLIALRGNTEGRPGGIDRNVG